MRYKELKTHIVRKSLVGNKLILQVDQKEFLVSQDTKLGSLWVSYAQNGKMLYYLRISEVNQISTLEIMQIDLQKGDEEK